MEFTHLDTGDKWVKRVVGYIPDVGRYPPEKIFLDPSRKNEGHPSP